MSELADKIYSLISHEGVTIKEAISSMIDVQFILLHDKTIKTESKEAEPSETVPFTPKTIKYDPMYDPAPPLDVERVPERVETPNRVLAKANTACICNGCKKVVYITNKDIKDGMKVADFIEAYTPTTGMKKLDKTTEIQNFDGNIACDCPVCGAVKQLFLTGGPQA